MKNSFPCTKCGACCRHVNLSKLTENLDRGDGICKNYCTTTCSCLIYELRPKVCRIDTYYYEKYRNIYSWDEYVQLNLIACKSLSELD